MAILAVAMGATVATALLTVSLNIREKVSRELRTYGANLLIVPMEDLSLLEWEGVDFKKEAESRGGFQTRPYIQESDLIRLKKTFWRNNILGFSPLLEADVQVKGRRRTLVGTWFDREMEIEGERV
ncbi:ABC transporter permease, partial [candidate division TA06 bacterium]|nr:ABC transporter permease [candidate division TA06 bacterium]